MTTAAILTIGDEILRGDIANTNAQWLARALSDLHVDVRVLAALPDDRASVARFVAATKGAYDDVVVTGGLGGTPDDVTRDAIATAFGVGCAAYEAVARELSAFGDYRAVFSRQWSRFPVGSRVLPGSGEGAPGFAVRNVYVMPGIPSEMRRTFKAIGHELGCEPEHVVWRERYATTEDTIAPVLFDVRERFIGVGVGSYPHYRRNNAAEVELVLHGPEAELRAAVDATVVHLQRIGVCTIGEQQHESD